MLALRPDAVLVAGEASAVVVAKAGGPPVPWATLKTERQVLDAARDVARAILARRLDPRTANAVLPYLQLLLTEKRARRTWAREQLRDRMNQLVEETRTVEQSVRSGHLGSRDAIAKEVGRLENLVDYVAGLARRVAS